MLPKAYSHMSHTMGGGLDHVSTLNGGLTVRIPLVSYPQRGSLSLSYAVIFNSFNFQDFTTCDAPPNGGGSDGTIPLHNNCHDNIQPVRTALFNDDFFAFGALCSGPVPHRRRFERS
jgi:hypothetical protein